MGELELDSFRLWVSLYIFIQKWYDFNIFILLLLTSNLEMSFVSALGLFIVLLLFFFT